jgi:hypothetical protein
MCRAFVAGRLVSVTCDLDEEGSLCALFSGLEFPFPGNGDAAGRDQFDYRASAEISASAYTCKAETYSHKVGQRGLVDTPFGWVFGMT